MTHLGINSNMPFINLARTENTKYFGTHPRFELHFKLHLYDVRVNNIRETLNSAEMDGSDNNCIPMTVKKEEADYLLSIFVTLMRMSQLVTTKLDH